MNFFGKKRQSQSSIQLEHHLHAIKIPANLRINDQHDTCCFGGPGTHFKQVNWGELPVHY